MKKLILAALIAATAGLTVHAEILEQIVVKVNGEIFTKSELEQRQVAALRQKNRGQQVDLNDAELKKALEDITPGVLVDAIDETLIMQQGKERGYRMSDDQFHSITERIRKENKLESDEAFAGALKQEGLTLDDLRKSLERQMIVSRVQGDAIGRVAVSEDEARRYYAEHESEFTSPAQLTLREVLVAVPTAKDGTSFSAGLDDEAKEKVLALRHRALGGEDFTQLVASASESASKANGGLIGPLNLSELAPALQKVLQPLKVGDVSEPVRTSKGYQILKVESLTPPALIPFDQAREQIGNKVYAGKRNAEFRKYMKKLREQAIIEWKNEELHKLYDKEVGAQTAEPAQPSI